MTWSFETREQNLKKLKTEDFDLAIIGGGITGAGVARDAASRGMKVALVEAKDFASGTSSRSSKLIHGGVRYLENLEFGLVFEALSERTLLFKLAPHLVHPLRFVIPIYKKSRVGYWKMLLGMWLYDLLALFRAPKMHESLGSKETCRRVASLNNDQLVGAMEYSDAYTDDDRLVIETLRDANRKSTVIANYTKVLSANYEQNKIHSVVVKDELTGEEFNLKASQFVSGVGPWTDMFGQKIAKQWKTKLRPTKGVHLVFSKKTIPIQKAIVMAVEKRIIFVIPRHEMVIVGTTDTDFKQDPIDVNTDKEDVQYLLEALNNYFPDLSIKKSDILSSYSGVRPLVNDGSDSEGKTSREHLTWSEGENLSFVAGGKYTTYRRISEQTVDFILKKMPKTLRQKFSDSQTKAPLNPKVDKKSYEQALKQIPVWEKEFVKDHFVVDYLAKRHGMEAPRVLSLVKKWSDQHSLQESMWMAEAEFAIENTMCLSLVDFYWRRSPLFLATENHGLEFLDGLLKVFTEKLGWSPEKQEQEKASVLAQIDKDLSWKK